jgi:integrase
MRSVASVTKTAGGWRAQVARKGVRKSKVFQTKREAQDWAARQEWLILNGDKVAAAMTFGEVLARYAREVSPKKRSHASELTRLERMQREDAIARVKLRDLSATDFAQWRDARLRQVTPSTVRRDMSTLGDVLSVARREWGLISDSPMRDVTKPPEHRPRDRLPTSDELQALALAAGSNGPRWLVWQAFRFSCETAMRAGEIKGIRPADVDLARRVVFLPMTKNGDERHVPITTAAADILRGLPPSDPVFGMRGRQLYVAWDGLRKAAGVEGLRFHDARAAGTTMLARKIDVMTLAKITGHRDLKTLLNTYYREDAASIAARLD